MAFRELPVSLYLRFDKPKAVRLDHMTHRRAPTITLGIDAIKAPIFPVSKD
jgi:hypothetical protein